jgi:nucleotide-binding universal stress UspA family protein
MYRVLEKEGTAALEQAKKYATEKGVTAITHMKQGHAGSEVVTLADKENADLIVVGSHGKSQADRLLIGSASTYVVTHSKVTTMVVRS